MCQTRDEENTDTDQEGPYESFGACPYCGKPMINEMEIGQGYHATAPCWMYANGLIGEAIEWERKYSHPASGAGDERRD